MVQEGVGHGAAASDPPASERLDVSWKTGGDWQVVGWLKKHYVECPSCSSSEVEVPWSLGRTRGRRAAGVWLAVLWATMAAWTVLGVVIDSIWPWAAALIAFSAVTAFVMVRVRTSLTRFRCHACGHSWPGRPYA